MTDLRDLECLLALARHRHFARAAQECGLSQPAFSMRIRNLEERLDTAIVKRGNRFQGLTSAGEAVAAHARLILDQVRAMEQEVGAQGGEVTGSLTLGVIPTASAYAAHAAYRLRRTHPDIRLRIESTTSLAIQQGMIDGTLDAGITYTEGVSGDMFRIDPLYGESYVLLAPAALVAPGATQISWKDAAALPLTLLEPGMQNRRILSRIFEDVGAQPMVVAETNGLIAALVMAVEGAAATVVPKALVDSLGPIRGTVALPLVDPQVEKAISFVTSLRPRRLPTVEAMRKMLLAKE